MSHLVFFCLPTFLRSLGPAIRSLSFSYRRPEHIYTKLLHQLHEKKYIKILSEHAGKNKTSGFLQLNYNK